MHFVEFASNVVAMSRLSAEQTLMTLEGRGPVLDVARDVSRIMMEKGIEGGVIGGIAVLLHGHARTTIDVDVYVASTKDMARALEAGGYEFHADQRAFVKHNVPVHLVTIDTLRTAPAEYQVISGVRVASLHDIIGMKLRSGTDDILRAQDLADVIGLIRRLRLSSEFASRLPKPLRSTFRKLARAIQRQDGPS